MGKRVVPKPLLVIGAGAWGTALAQLCAKNGAQVRLWSRDPKQASLMQATRINARYLPESILHVDIQVISDLKKLCEDQAHDILLAVPSHAIEIILQKLSTLIKPSGLCWAIKGIEPQSTQLISERVQHYFPNCAMAMIAGPSFAKEVMRGLVTAVTVAADHHQFGQYWATRLRNPKFRVYCTEDLIAAQVAGTLKNVLAIACGISDGLQFGANARAALMTRGLVEMTRLGTKMGGMAENFSHLEGLGDLILSCTDDQSRNRRLGLMLGEGETIQTALSSIGQSVEGLYNAQYVVRLAHMHQENLPICEAVHTILTGKQSPLDAANALLARPSSQAMPPKNVGLRCGVRTAE